MFNRSTAGSSLFGNANTSTPTSAPALTNNTQFPQKQGTLFGNTSANLGTSTPSPSNTLFANPGSNINQQTTQTGGSSLGSKPANNNLFGNTVGQAGSAPSSGSLFGNSTSATTGGLFGKSTPTAPAVVPSNSLFGSKPTTVPASSSVGGMFGNSGINAGGSTLSSGKPTLGTSLFGSSNPSNLFGNKQSNTANSGLFGNPITAFGHQTNTMEAQMNSNPYGLNVNNVTTNVSNMPSSITENISKKTVTNSESLSVTSIPSSDTKRSFSFSSVASNNIASPPVSVVSHSSLFNDLRSRLNSGMDTSVKGIFSSSHTPWEGAEHNSSALNGSTSNDFSFTVANKNKSVKDLSSFSNSKGVTELRRLKIDSDRSAAKKLKLLSGKSVPTKEQTPESHRNEVEEGNDIKGVENTPIIVEDEKGDKEEENIEEQGQDYDEKSSLNYWCSPSPEQLVSLSIKQLTAVPNFVVGRKGYGCITFNYDVDLTPFANDIKKELFHNVIVFRTPRTVEVYPEGSIKPPVGYGLNVPATITLENVYPVDKKTKQPITDDSKIEEIQFFVRKLKGMRDMEYISYNPFGGIWTFRVDHFSVWGLVNDEDIEIDEDEVHAADREEIDMANSTEAKLLALQQKSFSESAEAVDDYDSLIVEEKQYEPDVNEEDFEALQVDPSLDISDDWVEQLRLAGSSLHSVFAQSTATIKPDADERALLFSKFNEDLEIEKKIRKERRLTSKYTFAKFDQDSSLLLKKIEKDTGTEVVRLPVKLESRLVLHKEAFDKRMKLAAIDPRKANSYPKVVKDLLKFSDVLPAIAEDPELIEIWKLCSTLFDPVELSHHITNTVTKETLTKNRRYDLLCEWLINQIKDEIHSKINGTADLLDKVFLYLMVNDIPSATKIAIDSQNGHLAILLTFLGSNDPRVRDLASLQLTTWRRTGQKVDLQISRIYQLLSGSIFEGDYAFSNMVGEFSWLAVFSLGLLYGKIDENSLENLVASELSLVEKQNNDLVYAILQLFSTPKVTEALIRDIQFMDIQFSWYFVQILKFNAVREFSNELCDRITLSFLEQLKSEELYDQALFVGCYLVDDAVAKQQIDLLIYSNISSYCKQSSQIYRELQIPEKVVYHAQALMNKYDGDHFSEVQNLLHARLFKEAERVFTSVVGPKLILSYNHSKKNDDLSKLLSILSQFPQQNIDNWKTGLGVFEDYAKLVMHDGGNKEKFQDFEQNLKILLENNKHFKAIPACCNIMSKKMKG
ncbi:hypothetical protein KAFR_0C02090 [Kazachstania africana CBS 2517]|uniref:Peptidase S59 domain-containing protein n=1 Tax=Kazachstania africana (strain ATCC 22294 / BCRC 22015 / CBS 2517 / CECT 1963 / NBRC 1671 / NRRL Y-8276) TaxID=1071382 RepID=H2AS52_KAZAF|nr:hypothetical protein KAFR_0C02090 [Kazachstania africana CBS 2517]CCF57202.1 hypothetical protein KAFR_0C02090 [Kazachstania africana CBS 2517]